KSPDSFSEPILQAYGNIECRDALLEYDKKELVRDEHGKPVTRWDGVTTKKHPVTGEDVPDDTARVTVERYVNPRKAEWPKAEFVVGNPPFIGNKRMRAVLGDEYVDALRGCFPEYPESIDYVMYWWAIAGGKAGAGNIRRFGLITTNSLTQTFNSRVTQQVRSSGKGVSLSFAIADHPWTDSSDGAAVRIAMTVGRGGLWDGELIELIDDATASEDIAQASVNMLVRKCGVISSFLTIGFDQSMLAPLLANHKVACPGVQLSGQGFVLSEDELGSISSKTRSAMVRRYVTGRDLSQVPRSQYVIDTFGVSEAELRTNFSDAYQWLHDRVLPERLQNPREKYRRDWWLHSEPRASFRDALKELRCFIGTSRTARHRVFQFLSTDTVAETKVLVFAFDDAAVLGVLSSRPHVVFANRTGGWLGIGNDSTYNHSECLVKFPFPVATEAQQQRIRELGESLDAHRKKQQAAHPGLTITGMYNVLVKLRSGEALTDKEKKIHDEGLVSVLKKIHDDLDVAVFDAYGWPVTLSDDEILERLVALNHERAAEEKRGLIRWLRPEFQAKGGSGAVQQEFDVVDASADDDDDDDDEADAAAAEKKPRRGRGAAKKAAGRAAQPAKAAKQAWPKDLAEQTRAVRSTLATAGGIMTTADVARRFKNAKAPRVEEILATLVALGHARRTDAGYASA
ncbi:MAG: class I SAM-dependent DNA methyltransferase, partial [Planctomycetes bacterium]|nr:class I SAM-dependent DNA methyltransferase [Planctomycetota bacterium]